MTLLVLALLAQSAAFEETKVSIERLEVAKAIISIREAERDEASARAAYLEAQQRKAAAAARFEAAKRKLPGWYEGALLNEDLTIAPKPKVEKP